MGEAGFQNERTKAKHYMNEQGVLSEHIFLGTLKPRATSLSFIGTWKISRRPGPRFKNSTSKIDLEMMEIVDSTWDRSQVAKT